LRRRQRDRDPGHLIRALQRLSGQPDDPRIARRPEIESAQGSGVLRCTLAHPAREKARPSRSGRSCWSSHENRGLTGILGYCARLGSTVFALAPTPDAARRLSGDEDRARNFSAARPAESARISCGGALPEKPSGRNGRLGVIGLLGGGMSISPNPAGTVAGGPFYASP